MSHMLDLLQIVLVDISLAADNAIVVGMAAAALPHSARIKAISMGIGVAAVMRVALTLGATWVIKIPCVMSLGALALLWVCWQMWQGMRNPEEVGRMPSFKNLRAAILAIIVADLSMSVDNVLAVASIARDNAPMLVVGVGLSVALMGAASKCIAGLMEKYKWIGYLGLSIILWVAFDMWSEGMPQLLKFLIR